MGTRGSAKAIIFKAGTVLAAVACLFIWFENKLAKPDMMGFDPREMGRLESAMWRSYYEGRWVRLARETMEVACGQYGFSWWDGARLSLHAARAALFFRKNTDDPRCLPELENYYAIIRRATGRNFDVRAAAALELTWWKERRRGVAPDDYARTISRLTALVHGLPDETSLPGATMRARAMSRRDALRNEKMTDADWMEIARQLTRAYESFKTASSSR